VEGYDLVLTLFSIADRTHGQPPFLAKSAVLLTSGIKNAGTCSLFLTLSKHVFYAKKIMLASQRDISL